jgi:hypothetical protein
VQVSWEQILLLFSAKPGCPEYHRATVERMVNALPSSYLLLPRTGELFDSLDAYNGRLCGYALAEGFDTVKHGGGTKKIPSSRYTKDGRPGLPVSSVVRHCRPFSFCYVGRNTRSATSSNSYRSAAFSAGLSVEPSQLSSR